MKRVCMNPSKYQPVRPFEFNRKRTHADAVIREPKRPESWARAEALWAEITGKEVPAPNKTVIGGLL